MSKTNSSLDRRDNLANYETTHNNPLDRAQQPRGQFNLSALSSLQHPQPFANDKRVARANGFRRVALGV
ncbi:MAG: hypothetical protein J7641_19180 [Cyanobacteria bacterium SID2]|nr:hypothetical protein [Cyanobacteria bacterium SID2]MBP0004023.1 hypothetical protein [Cyanobacteria bacterium SBC]